MNVTGCYPVVMVEDVAATARFFRESLGFETVFETDWYVSLRTGSYELAVLARDHGTVPDGFGHSVRGMLINLEVEEAGPLHVSLVARDDVIERLPLRDEAFGQRHFIVEVPGGILIDVIQPIEPSAEFAAAYTA